LQCERKIITLYIRREPMGVNISIRRSAKIDSIFSTIWELRPELEDDVSTTLLLALGALRRECVEHTNTHPRAYAAYQQQTEPETAPTPVLSLVPAQQTTTVQLEKQDDEIDPHEPIVTFGATTTGMGKVTSFDDDGTTPLVKISVPVSDDLGEWG
jgi:hypothetical protein